MKFLKLLFSKIIVVVLLLLIQIVLIFAAVSFLELFPLFQLISIIIALSIFFNIVNKKESPEFKIPWLVLLFLLPLFTIMVYILFANAKMSKKDCRRLQAIQSKTNNHTASVDCTAVLGDNIGIENYDKLYAENKMLLYYAQIHANQLEYDDNRKVVKTVTINLLDFNYLKSDSYLNKIVIPSKTDEEIKLYVLELPKFNINSYKNITKKEAWMIYLCGIQNEIMIEVLKKFDIIKQLDNLLEEYWRNEVME